MGSRGPNRCNPDRRDRDRLAFLVETDAALDLDFKALEVQALEERPSYISSK